MKCDDFWRCHIDACRSNPRRLWQVVDQILGRGKPPPSDTIDVERFRSYFDDKVGSIRDATSGAPPPEFSIAPDGVQLPAFLAVSPADVASYIGRLPDKSSVADPIPTSVLKEIADLVSPYISGLFSRSLAAGYYPMDFKHAFITPIVKKAGTDASDVRSYRPITNLSVLSKLFERMVARQIWEHLTLFDLLPATQSGFRPGHSTESAILRVLSDILAAVDRGDFSTLVLLDL